MPNVGVGAGVIEGVGASVGPNNGPGPQLETVILTTNRLTAKVQIAMACRFVFIGCLRYHGRTRSNEWWFSAYPA